MPSAASCAVDDGREIGVLARQDARRDVDDGDLAAQPAERLRHLAADRAAADDDERAAPARAGRTRVSLVR